MNKDDCCIILHNGLIFKSRAFDDGAQKKDYATVLGKFDSDFIPNTELNLIHERVKFHQRNQSNGESVGTFIRSLLTVREMRLDLVNINVYENLLKYFIRVKG